MDAIASYTTFVDVYHGLGPWPTSEVAGSK